MIPEIKKIIKDDALIKYNGREREYEFLKRSGYIEGATRWAEIAIGFAYWKDNYNPPIGKLASNEELLLHYINNVLNKQSS